MTQNSRGTPGRHRWRPMALGGALVALSIARWLSGALSAGWREAIGSALILGMALLVLALYRDYWRRRQGRPPQDLRARGFVGLTLAGAALGSALFALVIGVMDLAGNAQIAAGPGGAGVLFALIAAAATGIFEEVISRGIILQMMERRWGSMAALAGSSLIFAALHAPNTGFSIMAGLGVLAAGVLLGAAFLLARSLWLPIALHAAWNFTQGAVFGASVSGHERTASLFITRFSGSDLVTGGAFGPEASLSAVIVVSLAAAGLLALAVRLGRLRPAAARRQPESHPADKSSH